MAFRSLLALSLALGLVAANPCYPGGTSTTVSTESTTATESASTTSSAAADPDCYRHIKILRDLVFYGIPPYNNGNPMTEKECLDACADSDDCVAFAYRADSICFLANSNTQISGPYGDDQFITGQINTC